MGYVSGSIGLFADSLDMLADAFVYGLSLLVIAGSMLIKSRIAVLSGVIQLGLYECVRRTIFGAEIPDYTLMIGISVIAMTGNLLSLGILRKQQSMEPHMRASMIFTSTDVLVNAGVIIAGLLTIVMSSIIPDLCIGCIIFILVFRGAFRIFRLQ
jgi:Co/Zn/Cd efflux system component